MFYKLNMNDKEHIMTEISFLESNIYKLQKLIAKQQNDHNCTNLKISMQKLKNVMGSIAINIYKKLDSLKNATQQSKSCNLAYITSDIDSCC